MGVWRKWNPKVSVGEDCIPAHPTGARTVSQRASQKPDQRAS